MLLVHPQMRPDRRNSKGTTERDVWEALKKLGLTVEVICLSEDLRSFDKALANFKPDVVFNLLEEFRSEAVYDFHAVSYLEALGVPYTGCNPRGLIVSRNKIWAVKIAKSLNILTPEIYSSVNGTKFPAFVKFVREHASRGLTERNRVRTKPELKKITKQMKKKFPGELVVQEFVPGEDVTVSVFGNEKLVALEPWRLNLRDAESFATERIKFSAKSRAKKGIRAYRYTRDNALELKKRACELYTAFDLSGYARFDFRVNPNGTPFFIDVNANPNLARGEDFSSAAEFADLSYPELIQTLLKLGRNYSPKV